MQFKINDRLYDLNSLTPDGDDKVTYHLIKLLIQEADSDLSKTTRKFNKLFPDEKTTSQNLSNKLYRDSLRVTQFLKLLSALGYTLSFDIVKDDFAKVEDTQPITPAIKDDKKFSDLLIEGYADCKSINFDSIIIAGARASEAAQWIAENLDTFKEMDETQEIMLLIAANREFKVNCKPVAEGRNFKMV